MPVCGKRWSIDQLWNWQVGHGDESTPPCRAVQWNAVGV